MEAKNELQRNAIAEARRKELESYQRALDVQWLNSRMEDGRTGRCLALIDQEAEMERDFQERTDHAAIVNARAEKETKLGMEVAKVRAEEVNQLMRRHCLRERDPSLRMLQKKLQAGSVCRDLQQQILQNQYKRLQDQVEENQANRLMSKAIGNDLETTEGEMREKMERNAQYSKELHQQLDSRQQERQCLYDDKLVENKKQEGIVRRMADEDQRALQYQRDETEKMFDEMVTDQHTREAWKDKQKKMVVMEEREIANQVSEVGDRRDAVVAERERKMHVREKNSEMMGEKQLAETEARHKREDDLTFLQKQEYMEKDVQHDIAEMVKEDKYRAESRKAQTALLKYRENAARELAHEEEGFRRQAQAQLDVEDERELEKERKKKETNHQYSLDLQKQIAGNKQRRAADKQLESERDRRQIEHDDAWQSEVQEERNNLQAGVIKHDLHDDLPVDRAGSDAREDVVELEIEFMAAGDRPLRFAKCNDQCQVIREY